jgi:hypothetical protein
VISDRESPAVMDAAGRSLPDAEGVVSLPPSLASTPETDGKIRVMPLSFRFPANRRKDRGREETLPLTALFAMR